VLALSSTREEPIKFVRVTNFIINSAACATEIAGMGGVPCKVSKSRSKGE
jgi:hypothetical protein